LHWDLPNSTVSFLRLNSDSPAQFRGSDRGKYNGSDEVTEEQKLLCPVWELKMRVKIISRVHFKIMF